MSDENSKGEDNRSASHTKRTSFLETYVESDFPLPSKMFGEFKLQPNTKESEKGDSDDTK